MFIPSEFYTEERKEMDMDILRVYYILCEELGVTEEVVIEKTFTFLLKHIGTPKFFDESIILDRYIDNLRNPNKKYYDAEIDEGNEEYFKTF